MPRRFTILTHLSVFVFVLVAMVTPAGAGEATADLTAAMASGKLRATSAELGKLAADGGTGSFLVLLKNPSRAAAPASLEADADKAAARQANAAVLEAFFARKKGAAIGEISRTFEYMPAFAVTVTAAQLAALAQSDDVAAIEVNGRRKPALRQGIPLMNAQATRSRYSGKGVAVAVCDTGVDYNNTYLGGPGFPNAVVLGGYDTGEQKADPMDKDGHGTSVAGIVAGALGDVANYIGGVAPGAKIYALKVTDASGTGPDEAIIAAWEWAITNQNKVPESPIRIINLSMGGGYFTSLCDDSYENYVTAAANAAKAGITIFASAGNEGYCDGLNNPACISGVISVGAVYDAAFGQTETCIAEESCAPSKEATTGCDSGYYAPEASEADAVPAYSNSASFLTLFASSNKCNTLQCAAKGSTFNTDFGGTSAASPYAAGAAAALQNAAKVRLGHYLTPAEVKAKLTETGDNITDAKVAVTKPRIDLGAAIDTMPASASNLLPLDIPAAIRN
ncbi:S8 family peptidase [Solidesulfovibrio sp.]|uniref:S8 family peptidase n=1 Tax=Solidesulfovibrio sp. TaxID=2910990 RepID=UPI002B20C740|nr:S8 family serine peptidase [Solidesulfovibrio sp.]MEA4855810.1 S8 family serine peptidase [Solidesulfovibrio sp.]